MIKAGTVKLIGETPRAHGVYETITETGRTVYCTVRSVGMRQMYQANAIGLNPEIVMVLAHDFEYKGEKECIYNSTRYKVIRTYVTEQDGIELTLERMEGNANV